MDAVLEIPLSRGMVSIIDAADFHLIEPFSWHAAKGRAPTHWYAHASTGRLQRERYGVGAHVAMHSLITGFALTDHINRNTLDNRRSNLRAATNQQNSFNSSKWRTPTTSRFKGVGWNKEKRVWRARIMLNNKSRLIGCFPTEEAAALAYDNAARSLFGQFAATNFPLAS